MSTISTLWQAQFTSIRRAGRHDTRMRVAFIAILIFDIALGIWSGSQLLARIALWQALGKTALSTGMWSICLLTWTGMSAVVMLETLQQGLSDDTSLLLFTLPMQPATRFRALYGMFFLSRLWNWLLLETGITGVVLLITLGWQAIPWLVLIQLGVCCAVCAGIDIMLLIVRYILPRDRLKFRVVSIVVPGSLIALVVIYRQEITNSLRILATWLRPEIVCLFFALLLVIALGPLAATAGRLYSASFLTMQSWDRSRKAITLPGIRMLSRLLSRQRSLQGGILLKGLLNQSRNFVFWGRVAYILVVLLIGLVFFSQVRSALAPYGFTDTLLVLGYAAGIALLSILEQAPSAISGEGNRLAIYLTGPFDMLHILRARLIVFLLPTLIEALAIDIVLSWRLGLTMDKISFVTLAIILLIVGCTALPTLGGVWDENLHLAVEGVAQTILQEEVPISPRCLALFQLSLALLAANFLLIWKLPSLLALAALTLLNGAVLIAMFLLSCAHVRHLIREG